MKGLGIILAGIALGVLTTAVDAAWIIRKVSVAGPTYVVDEGFEGTGYELTGWTEAAGTPDEDHTTTVKVGSQSLQMSGADEIYRTVADASTYTLEFWIYMSSIPTSPFDVGYLRTSGDAPVCLARMDNGGMSVYVNGADSTQTVDTPSINTWYKIQMKWVESGTCSVEFNTSGTFDGTGNDYTSRTASTGTIGRLGLKCDGGRVFTFDDIKLQ